MTNLQFILLLKHAFIEYFFTKKACAKPSLMNLIDLVELFRNEVEKQAIKDYKKTIKSKLYECNNDKK